MVGTVESSAGVPPAVAGASRSRAREGPTTRESGELARAEPALSEAKGCPRRDAGATADGRLFTLVLRTRHRVSRGHRKGKRIKRKKVRMKRFLDTCHSPAGRLGPWH